MWWKQDPSTFLLWKALATALILPELWKQWPQLGGRLCPPVMGAAVFMMADFLEIPYLRVCIAAAIPAILYYLAVFIIIDLEAAKTGLQGVPCDNLKPLKLRKRTKVKTDTIIQTLVFFITAPSCKIKKVVKVDTSDKHQQNAIKHSGQSSSLYALANRPPLLHRTLEVSISKNTCSPLSSHAFWTSEPS